VREFVGADRLHMPSRLDRETSGVLVFARNAETGRRLQHAMLQGRVRKTYIAVLEGELRSRAVVDQPVGRDPESAFFSRQCIVPCGQPSLTEFEPVAYAPGHTLVRVYPLTGRRHQIRVHAAWIRHPVAGDKLYGRDPGLMFRLMERGFPDEELAMLPMPRHALHAAEIVYGNDTFQAPLSDDIAAFWRRCQSGL
jgi:23S rRNA pseudouridine1911/1915/1917 synthase